jgi:hypothetical protein
MRATRGTPTLSNPTVQGTLKCHSAPFTRRWAATDVNARTASHQRVAAQTCGTDGAICSQTHLPARREGIFNMCLGDANESGYLSPTRPTNRAASLVCASIRTEFLPPGPCRRTQRAFSPHPHPISGLRGSFSSSPSSGWGEDAHSGSWNRTHYRLNDAPIWESWASNMAL